MNIKHGLCGIVVKIRENNSTTFDILGIYPDVYKSILKVKVTGLNKHFQHIIYKQISKTFKVKYCGKTKKDEGYYYIFEVLKN